MNRKEMDANCHNIKKIYKMVAIFFNTLFANRTQGILLPSGRLTLESKSAFHLMTASNVAERLASNTMKAPTASL